MKKLIRLDTLDKVKDFVNIMLKYPDNAYISCKKYTVDAKSILGILSLNLMEDLTLVLEGNDDSENKNILENLKIFLV